MGKVSYKGMFVCHCEERSDVAISLDSEQVTVNSEKLGVKR